MSLKNIKAKKIAILGAGGHGKVVGEIAHLNNFKIIDFFDDNYKNIKNYPFSIKGNLNKFKKLYNQYDFWFISVGNNLERKDIFIKFKKFRKNLTNLIHPKSIVSKLSKLEYGICIMANSVVNAGSKIKKGSIINTSASIDHDCIICNFVHIAPNVTLCGNVLVDNETLIGAGSSVHPNTKIGKNVKIAIGSKVFRDLGDSLIYINNNGQIK